MKLIEENLGNVLCSEMPETEEYSDIIYEAQEAGRIIGTDYTEFSKRNAETRHKLYFVMAACIARGKRLQKEQKR